jgi:branched-chain amino acid transport system ATP-binding protein
MILSSELFPAPFGPMSAQISPLATTIVLIKHDIGVVTGLSHHVVVLDSGKKVGDRTPEEVRRNQEVIDAYLGVKH